LSATTASHCSLQIPVGDTYGKKEKENNKKAKSGPLRQQIAFFVVAVVFSRVRPAAPRCHTKCRLYRSTQKKKKAN
jgi:hypothetical protein